MHQIVPSALHVSNTTSTGVPRLQLHCAGLQSTAKDNKGEYEAFPRAEARTVQSREMAAALTGMSCPLC